MKLPLILLAAIAAPACAQTIDIHFDGATASVSIPESVTDVISSTSGAYVTITSATAATEYTYHVSGTTTDGGLTINGSYKLTLELDNADITSQRGAAIDIEVGKRIAVVLPEGTTTTLADNKGGAQKACLYFKGHPEFSGAGTLNVTGNTKHAIAAKEYLQLKKSVGTINILASASDGIHCGKGKLAGDENEFFIMNGGVVNMENIAGDCIDADDFGSMNINGGTLNLNVTATDVKAMKCANDFVMEGGNIFINITGDDSDGIYFTNTAQLNGGTVEIIASGDGTKGIKGKAKLGEGSLTLGQVKLNITAIGGNYLQNAGTQEEDIAHCVAISVDGSLNRLDEGGFMLGDIRLVSAGEARRLAVGQRIDGAFTMDYYRWYANPYDYQYDMPVFATLSENGNIFSALNNYNLYAFVNNECRGQVMQSNFPYFPIRIYGNVASGETVRFVIHDRYDGRLYDSPTTIAYNGGQTIGSPDEPVAIELGQQRKGFCDVNGDGRVDVTDLNLVIDAYKDNDFSTATDVNGDGSIAPDDITTVLDVIEE